MKKIKIGIIGYGNLGRGVESAVSQQADMELTAIFSRRGASGIKSSNSTVMKEHVDEIINYKEKIDVMILCGGSANDLPEQSPYYAQWFNIVDSFDNHSEIPNHFAKVDKVSTENNTLAVISAGWDPGLFSLHRVLGESFLPQGNTYTFWGKGLSQGHSDAIRRINGVKNGVQYTIPSEEAIDLVRKGEEPDLTVRDKHLRVCYVVLEKNADPDEIEEKIKTMPNYFEPYDTEVHFIDEETLVSEHSQMPHGGFVIRSGQTGGNHHQLYEFSLALDSNPEFTSSVLITAARAAYRMHQDGESGAKTMLDIAPRYYSMKTNETLRKDYL